MEIIHNISFLGFIGLAVYAAWSDARTLRIPNWISLWLVALFFTAGLGAGMGMMATAIHLAVGAGALVIGFALFAMRLFGGGDAKLFAAIALWMGWPDVLYFAIALVMVGGAVALLAVLLRRGLGLWPDWVVRYGGVLFEKDKALPYGIAITAGAIITIPRMDLVPDIVLGFIGVVTG